MQRAEAKKVKLNTRVPYLARVQMTFQWVCFVSNTTGARISNLNSLLRGKRMAAFWKRIGQKLPTTYSSLFAQDIARSFREVTMTDDLCSISGPGKHIYMYMPPGLSVV
jgi:hypothetical protein